jgi:regulator of RNase E activity RraA
MKYEVITTFETVGHVGTLVHAVTLNDKKEPISNAVTFVPGAVISADDEGNVTVQTGKQLLAEQAGENNVAALEQQAYAILEKIGKSK